MLTDFDLILVFWGLRRPRGGLETSKMDSPSQKNPILISHMPLYSLWRRNGEKLDFDPFLGHF